MNIFDFWISVSSNNLTLCFVSAGVEWQQNQWQPWCFSRETTQPHTSKLEWQQIERHQHIGTIGMCLQICQSLCIFVCVPPKMCIFVQTLCFLVLFLMLNQCSCTTSCGAHSCIMTQWILQTAMFLLLKLLYVFLGIYLPCQFPMH